MGDLSIYLPRSAAIAELIRLAGPPIQNPVTPIRTEFIVLSLGDTVKEQ